MAFDVTDLSYLGINYALSTVEPRGMAWNPNGLFFALIDAADNAVKGFNVEVANNVSTAEADSNTFTLETNAQGLAFNNDGTKIYYVDQQTIKERTLSVAWDVSTAGAATTLDVSADLASTDPQDVFLGDSGDKLFFTDDNDLSVHLYDLGTAYDISTATYNSGKVVDLSSRFPGGDGLVGLHFKPDGTALFVGVGYDTDGSFFVQSPAIRQFALTTAWDLDTVAEIASTDANIAQLMCFMPHFASGDYDWVLGRNKTATVGTVAFGDSNNSGAWIGGLVSGEGGMYWDDANNAAFWGTTRTAPATWEGRIRFFRRPDNAGIGGTHRLMVGSAESPLNGISGGSSLARPWSLVWEHTSEAFGLMAAGSGIQVSAGAEGGDWNYGQFLDFTVQREDAGGGNATFRFWLQGKYYGSRTTSQSVNNVLNSFAYGKNGGIAGWDFASGLQQVWIRGYTVAKYTATDHGFTEHSIDQTALNIVGRSVADETGRESTATYIAFSNDGEYAYVAANDSSVGNFIFQYNLGATIPSCTGSGFQAYVEGGTARLLVSTVSGAHHLEGQTVKAVVDGALYDVTIVNGQPQLPSGVSGAHIQVGHGYTCDIVTLPLSDGEGRMQGKEKSVKEVLIKLYKSVMPQIGPDRERMTQMKHPEKDDFDTALPLYTGQIQQRIERDWNKNGQIVIRQKDPYPLTVTAVAPEVPDMEDDE